VVEMREEHMKMAQKRNSQLEKQIKNTNLNAKRSSEKLTALHSETVQLRGGEKVVGGRRGRW
jgi:hypothetical protein